MPLERLRHRDPSNFVPLGEIHLGGKVISALSGPHSIDATVLHNFRLRCLEFYIEAAAQILTRFPLDNIQMKRLEAIDPQVVIEKRVPSIAPLAASFPTLLAEENGGCFATRT